MSQSFTSTTPTVKCVTPPCIWLTVIIYWSSLWDLTTEVIHIKILLTWHMHMRKGSSPPSWSIFQVAIDWIVASDRGPRPFCTPSARGHSFKRALPYHIKVEILLHPVGSAVKLFSHFHDVERVQGIHYRGSLYASCKREKLKDYISRTQPLLNTFPARSLQLIRPLMNTQT